MGSENPDVDAFNKQYRKTLIKIHPDKIKDAFLLSLPIKEDYKTNINIDTLKEGVKLARDLLTFANKATEIAYGGKISLYKRVYKKEILGKSRVIYKISGSNKEYIKNKGQYISVVEYKKSKKM